MKEFFEFLKSAPISMILILAGLLFLFLSIFEFSRGNFKTRKSSSTPGMALGFVLFLFGLVIFFWIPVPPAEATPTPTLTTVATTVPSETPKPVATLVAASTIEAPMPTETASAILELKDLSTGCIALQTWQIQSTASNLHEVTSVFPDGCLNFGGVGISAEQGGILRLFHTAKKNAISSGIFTPVQDDSIIEFRVHIDSMYIVYADVPAFINFAVVSVNAPLPTRDSARFRLHVDQTEQKPLIYFTLADLGENTGTKVTSQHYEYGRTYSVRLELAGVLMRVFINDVRMSKDLALPSGRKAFVIGYDLPVQAGVDAEISDIRVDGIVK